MTAEAAAEDLIDAAAVLRQVAAKWENVAHRIIEAGEVDETTAMDVKYARDLLATRT